MPIMPEQQWTRGRDGRRNKDAGGRFRTPVPINLSICRLSNNVETDEVGGSVAPGGCAARLSLAGLGRVDQVLLE